MMQETQSNFSAPTTSGWFLVSAVTLMLLLAFLIILFVLKALTLEILLLASGPLAFIIWGLFRGWRYATLLQLVLLGAPAYLFAPIKLGPFLAAVGFLYFLLTVRTACAAGFDLIGYSSRFLPPFLRTHYNHRAIVIALFLIVSVGLSEARYPSLISRAPDPAYTEQAKRLPDEGNRKVFLIETAGPIELVIGNRLIDSSLISNADTGIILSVEPSTAGDLRLTGLEGKMFMQSLGPGCKFYSPLYPVAMRCPSAEYWWRLGRAQAKINRSPQRVVVETGVISGELELWYRRLDP